MLQKSSARKGFCAEGWRIWRVKWYIQHAGSAVSTRLPRGCVFFEKSFRVPKIVIKGYLQISELEGVRRNSLRVWRSQLTFGFEKGWLPGKSSRPRQRKEFPLRGASTNI